MKAAIALAALVAMTPAVVSAETAPVIYIPRADRFIQHVHVKTGTTVDVALPQGESLTANPIVGDPRWIISTFASGSTAHVLLKPAEDMGDQLLTMPGSDNVLHLVISSGKGDSTAYTVDFFEPRRKGVAASPKPRPATTPAPPAVTIASCAAPLDSSYTWNTGDKRIDVIQTCDDGKRTFIFVRDGRNAIGAVPYRVSSGQDQIANATFSPATADRPGLWVIDGRSDKWALVADSNKGQIRREILYAGQGVAAR